MTFSSLQATDNFRLYTPPKLDISTSTFESFMGKKFNPSSIIERAVYSFFKSGEASIKANHLEPSIKNLHPINLQALLLHARELARANGQTQKVTELTSSLEQLENDKKLKPVNGNPKFNSQLEPKTLHSILKIISLTAGLGFLVLATPLKNLLTSLTPESGTKLTEEICLKQFSQLKQSSNVFCPTQPKLTEEICLKQFSQLKQSSTSIESLVAKPGDLENISTQLTSCKSEIKNLEDKREAARIVILAYSLVLIVAVCAAVYSHLKYKAQVDYFEKIERGNRLITG